MSQLVLTPGPGPLQGPQGEPGDTIVLTPGLYPSARLLPQPGQTWLLDGAVLDGMGQTDYAFSYVDPDHPAGVRIQGGTIQHYTGQASVLGDNVAGWVLDGVTVLDSGGHGIEVGSGWVLRDVTVLRSQRAGLTAYLAARPRIIRGEYAFNNLSGADSDTPTGEGSGMKFFGCTDVVLESVFAHDNQGPGIWCDGNCAGVRMVRPLTRNNRRGIQIELSTGVILEQPTCVQEPLGIFVSGSTATVINPTYLQCQQTLTTYDGVRPVTLTQF